MGSSICSKWELDSLMKTWNSLFDHKYYKVHNEDIDIQGLYLLLEGVYDKVHQFATRFSNTTASFNKAVIELEKKQKENQSLKKELLKVNNCEKCRLLEIKLAETTKKANEAHNRMNSIAKILFLGPLEGNNDERRNTALSIVSQMLLTETSPKRKRRCPQTKNSPSKENVIFPASMDTLSENVGKEDHELGAVGGCIIPETMTHSPLQPITNIPIEKTPPRKKIDKNRRLSSSVNIPVENAREVSTVKKNLSLECVSQESDSDVIAGSPVKDKKKTLSFNINLGNIGFNKDGTTICGNNNNDSALDGTLLEYVKDGRSELDKIWFDDEHKLEEVVQRKVSTPKCNEIAETSKLNQIIEETPSRDDNFPKTLEKRKRADFWLLKEKKELSEKSKTLEGKKLRQTKLELGVKPIAVDITKLAGFNGGVHQIPQDTQDKDEDIIPGSPNSQIFGEGPTTINEINLERTAEFLPGATSTQKTDGNVDSKRTVTTTNPKEFVYKRDAVRKKSERAKLPGWDCDECRMYYEALSLSPSKIKQRMNACSRHRDKFKPKLNDTPPGFWNPLFPDTQECRDKGMYVSIYGGSSSNDK